MTQILELAYELLIEILGHLPPSSIIHSCRQVCQRFHQASHEKSTWLRVLAHCDYALPHIDTTSESAHDLERILLRAEIVKDVWTGQREARVEPLTPLAPPGSVLGVRHSDPLGECIGVMKQYVIFTGHRREAKWSWCALDRLEEMNTEAAFVFAPESKSFEKIPAWTGGIMHDTGVFYAIYTQTDILTDHHYLRVDSVNILSTGSFEVKQEQSYHSYHLGSRLLLDAITESQRLGISFGQQVCIGYGYIGIIPILLALEEPIRLLHLKTGEIVLCPWHGQVGDRKSWNDYLRFELTPWHFIQLRRDFGTLEVFGLPEFVESREPDSPYLHAYLMHRVMLPFFPATPFIFPRTPTSYVFCLFQFGPLCRSWDNTLIFHLDLSSSVARVRVLEIYEPGPGLRNRSLSVDFSSSISPLSNSVLGVIVIADKHVVLGLRLDLRGSLPVVGLQNLESLNSPGHGPTSNVRIVEIDPSTGRVIMLTRDTFDSSGFVVVRDYASL